jgi:DNA replication ATP-dependent helicase Dna2
VESDVRVADAVGGDYGQPARDGGCFLCAFTGRACAIPMAEGRIVALAPPVNRDAEPTVTLALENGFMARVTLNDQAKSLIQALRAMSAEQWRGLRLRVFHLTHATPVPADALEMAAEPLIALRALPEGVVILEPDLLLNITDINNAEYCARQYPLRRMIPSPPNAPTLRGTLIHRAFADMLKSGDTEIEPHLKHALRQQAVDLALRQITYEQMREDAEPHLLALSSWYVHQRETLWRAEPRLRAETFLLAPEVGLKGRLDFLMSNEFGGSLLELKTGEVRSQPPKREHRWQVYGYHTLLAARGRARKGPRAATLLYSGAPGRAEAYGIPFTIRDLRRVLELRNLLALIHVTGRAPRPPGGNTCGRCVLRSECARMSGLLDWEAPPIDEGDERKTADDASWYARWQELLRLEARAAEEEGAALWTRSPAQRRVEGSALGGLRLADEPRQTERGEWEYTFACEHTSELREGDAILLSEGDPVRGEVVTGTILRLSEHGLTVWTPERIVDPALIDRYESEITHDRTMRNLWRWLDTEPRLRLLVSSVRTPTFGSTPELTEPASALNEEQLEATRRALAAQDYLLVQGPPGTGKTSVVAEIARQAIARGERVLLAGFTNQAVDNALRRIVASGERNIVRLGHEYGVAEDIRPYRLIERASLDVEPNELPDLVRIRETLTQAPLVASTAATWASESYDGVGEPLRFDLALIDEATQLTVPALVGALRFARRFVLIGDTRQLPPLARSEEAAEHGLKCSLFETLWERHGAVAGVSLTRQYRMHPIICAFPSQAFYGGALVAAGEAQTATLDLDLPPGDASAVVLDPARPLVFVDIRLADGAFEPPGKANVAQAEVVRKLTLALLRAGMSAEEIGVIAPYRAQVATIRQRLAQAGETQVTVDTVDRFQGAERRVILLSFGGTPAAGTRRGGHDFLADARRLNVALTRAQRKLILVGSRAQLEGAPLLRDLIRHCEGLYGGRGGVFTTTVRGDRDSASGRHAVHDMPHFSRDHE